MGKRKDSKLKEHYAGELSKPFWDKVNSYEGKKQDELYHLGCILQSLEVYVLKKLVPVKTKRSVKR